MDKEDILREIKHTTHLHGGKPLGEVTFARETGIQRSDWFGRYWIRWSDAVREAGFVPNTLQSAFNDDDLIERLIELIRELQHFPVLPGDILLKRRRDPAFPSVAPFQRLGTKNHLVARVLQYCGDHKGFEDVVPLISEETARQHRSSREMRTIIKPIGAVYLLKSGRNYKIGKTNAFGRRERELQIQLPEDPRTIHVIMTDDPAGIEEYWHKRFAPKRKRGEWFELDADDLSAFKRRKFM